MPKKAARTSRPRKHSESEERFITGRVTSVNIKGFGPNSAQVVFTVTASTQDQQAIMITSPPAYEPQVFVAMAAFVSAAYFLRRRVTAGYVERHGETNYAIEVFSP